MFAGDPAATDSTRVLRLPGFTNKKYLTDFLVRAEKHTDHVYRLADFRLRNEPIDYDFQPQSRFRSHRRDVQRPLSQSEGDWMYTKRALARLTLANPRKQRICAIPNKVRSVS